MIKLNLPYVGREIVEILLLFGWFETNWGMFIYPKKERIILLIFYDDVVMIR
jgi:hypothetical protein